MHLGLKKMTHLYYVLKFAGNITRSIDWIIEDINVSGIPVLRQEDHDTVLYLWWVFPILV